MQRADWTHADCLLSVGRCVLLPSTVQRENLGTKVASQQRRFYELGGFWCPPPPVFHFVLWMDYIWSRCVLLFSLSNWTCWETGRPLLIYCTTIKRLFSKTHLQHWCPPQWNESLSGLLQFEAHPRQTKNRRGRQLEEIIMTHVDICCVLNFASTMLVYKPLFLAL